MLPSFYGVIEVKHYHSGYLRLQTNALRYHDELKDTLLENLKKVEGLESIQINTMLGSILVIFEEKKIEASFLYLIILKILGLEEEAFRRKPGKLKLLTKNVAESIDFSIYNKTKGILDFKMIVASLFVYYGMKQWRLNPQLPSGATLLWWAYNLISKGKE